MSHEGSGESDICTSSREPLKKLYRPRSCLKVINLEFILRLKISAMIGCLWTCVHKQPIVALYFESEIVLKFYNLDALCDCFLMFQTAFFAVRSMPILELSDILFHVWTMEVDTLCFAFFVFLYVYFLTP